MYAILLFPILKTGQDKHEELRASYSSLYFVGAMAIAPLELLRLFKWLCILSAQRLSANGRIFLAGRYNTLTTVIMWHNKNESLQLYQHLNQISVVLQIFCLPDGLTFIAITGLQCCILPASLPYINIMLNLLKIGGCKK